MTLHKMMKSCSLSEYSHPAISQHPMQTYLIAPQEGQDHDMISRYLFLLQAILWHIMKDKLQETLQHWEGACIYVQDDDIPGDNAIKHALANSRVDACPLLEECRCQRHHQLRPVRRLEDGPPWVLYMSRLFAGRLDVIQLLLHIVYPPNVLEHLPALIDLRRPNILFPLPKTF